MMTNNRKFRIIEAYNMHTDKYDEYKKDMLYAKSTLSRFTIFGFKVASSEDSKIWSEKYRLAKRRMKRRLAMIHRLEMLYPDLCMR